MASSRKRKGSDAGDEEVSAKKSKGSVGPEKQTDDDGNVFWELSAKRRLQISEYKGVTMVNIREYYQKDGKTLPGKAGINLPIDQFKTFLSVLPQVFRELKDKGVEIELPDFAAARSEVKKPKRSNIEETSEEDEGED
ncbi:uncharacterized protein PV09_05737 [Verruconis gallopava]|uniref:Transcriptional coactivator p15 (PC4) C-terminal domain-containing protein n=1 Tax=Verruconis gallopava TaxID=253628 RepID=A0A0D1YR89_9PEZI|nr:uncharacterized protein PV09_05737 [Verruconis gallopava]KIW03092.1 hypothetical protein PV09_05737 [Verruconis gallopava]